MTVFANVSCVVPQWDVSSRVTAFTTTRIGGVSNQPFHSLNLGLHVGDEKPAVLENRRRMVNSFALPAEPLWLNQTHGTVVVDVAKQHDITSTADGAYTCLPQTVLSVLTADCLPVVISDTQGEQVAVAHAGWRGLANGILENAIHCFKQGSELHAWLGPAIGPSKFEVGDDVRDVFVSNNSGSVACFSQGNKPGKYWADLYALATERLTGAGCAVVTGAQFCTHTQSDLFHSHRRDGTASGRMATVVWIS